MNLSNDKHDSNLYLKHVNTYSRDNVLKDKYGDRYLEYRSKWNEDVNSTNIPDFPLHYEIMLSDKCNLRCAICHKRRRTGNKIDLDLIKKAIEEGKGKLCAISFGLDSESLIDLDLLTKVIAYAHEADVMDIFVATNGILLTSDVSKKMIDAGVTLINVSVDAASEKTYKIMRNSDKFDIVENNIKECVKIRNAQKVKLPQIRLSFCKTYANAYEEQLFIDKWYGVVDQIDIQNYISTVGDFSELDRGEKIKTEFCKDPFRRVGILANGDVQCCCCSFGHEDIVVGNINESKMSEIWNGRKMKSIQNAFLNSRDNIPEYCKICLDSRYIF